jgi:hypothetical protein
MVTPLWQVLLKDPSKLTCDECFAVLEYYSELLAKGGDALLPEVMEHVRGCPECRFEHREALRRLEIAYQEDQDGTEDDSHRGKRQGQRGQDHRHRQPDAGDNGGQGIR